MLPKLPRESVDLVVTSPLTDALREYSGESEWNMKVFRQVAERRGVQPLFLKSGPAHDAASSGSRVPVGLLFVPSIKGLSHCPQEATAPEVPRFGGMGA